MVSLGQNLVIGCLLIKLEDQMPFNFLLSIKIRYNSIYVPKVWKLDSVVL